MHTVLGTMQPHRYRTATAALLGGAVAAAAGAIAVAAAVGPHGPDRGNFGGAGAVTLWVLNMSVAAGVGAVVGRTRPDNRIGWLLSIGGFVGALAALGDQWALYVLRVRPGEVPGATLGAALSTAGLYLSWGLLGVLTIQAFPDGRFDSRARRRVAWVGGVSAIACAMSIFSPDLLSDPPFKAVGVHSAIAISPLKPVIGALFVGIFGLMGSLLVSVGMLVGRLVRARGVERQQLRVIAFAAAFALVVGIVCANLQRPLHGTWAETPLAAVRVAAILVVPVALGVAILRYRLYDVDRVVARAVTYGLLLGFVTLVYVVVVVAVGHAIGQGDRPNLALSIAATAVVALAFQPVRARLERLANRLVYGRRASPYEVVAGFARRMADALSLDDALPRLAEAAATGVGAVSGRVEVLADHGSSRTAIWPDPAPAATGPDHVVPIIHQGEEVGRLGVTLGQGDVLDPAEERLLSDLASQAGVAVRNAQLATELQNRLEEISDQALELRRSRQRIVAAGDEERKRVERDLHDGAQQRLVSLGLVLRMARSRAPSTLDADLHALLDEAAGELESAQRELRDLARGIYPAVLVDGGLAPAIESLAERSTVPLDVRVVERRFPTPVETTAYFVVSEALTNVAKHAHASRASVLVDCVGDTLHIEVADDGVGGATGLRGLSDRVAALDGRLHVDSPPGGGTRVVADVPCE